MTEKNYIRFLLSDDNKENFVYRSPSDDPVQVQKATSAVKFCMGTIILDPWWIVGGTRWSRTICRLKHPIVYSKRGLRSIGKRIKRFFYGDPPAIMCREWKTKEEMLHLYPEVKNGIDQD